MKVLVLGGGGYIGFRLCKELQTDGMEVDSVDLLWFGQHRSRSNFKRDVSKINQHDLESYDVVILLSGHSSIAMCENAPLSAVRNNVRNFKFVLELLRPDQCFIYASSSSVYGQPGEIVVGEDCKVPIPTTIYVETKLAIEKLAIESLHERWWGLRLGTVCGGSPNLRVDLMVNAMYHSTQLDGIVVSFGGIVHRPILAMKDLIEAIRCILKSRLGEGRVYNVSSLNTTNVEVAERVASTTEAKLVYDDFQVNHHDFLINTDLFEKTFDWHPQETVEDIVNDLKRYYSYAYKGVRRGTVEYD